MIYLIIYDGAVALPNTPKYSKAIEAFIQKGYWQVSRERYLDKLKDLAG